MTGMLLANDNYCFDLAASLNANYHSTALFNPSWTSSRSIFNATLVEDNHRSLPDYLNTTGVLLSVCIDDEDCTQYTFEGEQTRNSPFSGSWIQESTTGPRIFEEGPAIGMILDPYEVEINCIYPFDGVTDGRDNHGCGAVKLELGAGRSPWITRLQYKVRLYYKKHKYFRHTKWEDIPCSELLFDDDDVIDDDSNVPYHDETNTMWDHDDESWVTANFFLMKLYEAAMGHVVCYDDSVPQNLTGMLTYGGMEPWMPSQWDENAAITKRVIANHQRSSPPHDEQLRIWNEIAMTPPFKTRKRMQAAVRAIFYVHYIHDYDDDDDTDPFAWWERAKAQADRFGGVPILKLNKRSSIDSTEKEEELFTCSPKRPNPASSAAVS